MPPGMAVVGDRDTVAAILVGYTLHDRGGGELLAETAENFVANLCRVMVGVADEQDLPGSPHCTVVVTSVDPR